MADAAGSSEGPTMVWFASLMEGQDDSRKPWPSPGGSRAQSPFGGTARAGDHLQVEHLNSKSIWEEQPDWKITHSLANIHWVPPVGPHQALDLQKVSFSHPDL